MSSNPELSIVPTSGITIPCVISFTERRGAEDRKTAMILGHPRDRVLFKFGASQ